MNNLLLFSSCLIPVLIIRQNQKITTKVYQHINTIIIYLSLPAISFFYVPQIHISFKAIYPLVASLLVLGMALLFFHGLARLFPFEKATLGCLVLTCGLSNTSFVGFPLVEALYGTQGLKIALLVDQGAFITLSTLGISLGMLYSTGKIKLEIVIRRILGFPPFIAFLAAIGVAISGISYPSRLQSFLYVLGSIMPPLALISIGLQLKINRTEVQIRYFLLGLAYKLLVAPLFIGLVYMISLEEYSLISKVSVIESAMPPMITASIIASEYKLNAPLANLLAGMGIPVSLFTVVGWYWFLG